MSRGFPNSRRAALRASSAGTPAAARSFAFIRKCSPISSWSSCCNRVPRKKNISRRHASASHCMKIPPLCCLDNLPDRADHAVEFRKLRSKLFSARCRQPVIPCPPIIFRGPPLRRYPALDEHSLQSRIERAFFHLKNFIRELLDSLSNAVTVHRTVLKGLEDHQVKCSGQNLGHWAFLP